MDGSRNILQLNNRLLELQQGNTDGLPTYTTADPYGQLLIVTNNLWTNLMYYLADIKTESRLTTATRNSSIRGIAAARGYNARRNVSSTGVVRLNPKQDVGNVILYRYMRFECENNNLEYVLNISNDYIIVSTDGEVSLPIIQGISKSNSFTSYGGSVQSYSIQTEEILSIEDSEVYVTVNGKMYTVVEKIYDGGYGDPVVMVRNNSNNGIDIIFGIYGTHEVPSQGNTIVVDYLISAGISGNVSADANFKCLDPVVTMTGERREMDQIFSASSKYPMVIGSNFEDIDITKIVLSSGIYSGVMYDENSIRTHLSRMGLFSNFSIVRDSNENINKYTVSVSPKLVTDKQYWDMTDDELTYDQDELNVIEEYVDGIASVPGYMDISLTSPSPVKFALIVIYKLSSGYDKYSVTRSVYDRIGDYMANNHGSTFIPMSDITNIAENTDGIDYVKILASTLNGTIDSMGSMTVDQGKFIHVSGGFTDSDGNEVLDYMTLGDEGIGKVTFIDQENLS